MRKLVLRESETHEVPFYDLEGDDKVDTGIKLIVDYPTIEQQDILDDLHNAAMVPALNRAQEMRLEKAPNGEELSDKEMERINRECSASIDPVKFRTYKRKVVKFALKGIIDPNSPDMKIELEEKDSGTEIKDDLFKKLIRDKVQADLLYMSIKPEIEFTESDKKK